MNEEQLEATLINQIFELTTSLKKSEETCHEYAVREINRIQQLEALEKQCNDQSVQSHRLMTEFKDTCLQLQVQDEIRKRLHNRLIVCTGNMRVFVRVRPSFVNEQTDTPFAYPLLRDRDLSSTSSDLTKNLLIVTDPHKDHGGLTTPRQKEYKFYFDQVFSPDHTQDSIWTAVEPLIQSSIDGFNVCIFAYGQTGPFYYHRFLVEFDMFSVTPLHKLKYSHPMSEHI